MGIRTCARTARTPTGYRYRELVYTILSTTLTRMDLPESGSVRIRPRYPVQRTPNVPDQLPTVVPGSLCGGLCAGLFLP